MPGTDIDIAERITYFREEAELTQADLARAIGKDPSAVSHWEAKRHRPSMDNLIAIAGACGQTLRSFLTSKLPRRAG